VLAFLGLRSFNPYTGVAPHIDSGVYLGVGEHLLRGRVLYREVWDHKPPVTGTLDALALALGDHTVNAVRTMERWWAAFAAVAVFAIALLAFGDVTIAGVASLLFLVHFYHPNVMRGNQPEEYGSILTLGGVALCLASLVPRVRTPAALATGAGVLFGLACLTKETFALGVLPWLGFVLWAGRHDRRLMLRRGAYLLAGLLMPPLVFVIYLAWNGAVPDFLDVVRFNLHYVRFDAASEPNSGVLGMLLQGCGRGDELVFGVSRVTVAAAVLGVVSVAFAGFRRRMRGLPVALVAFLLLNLAAVSLARRYGYYYSQLVSGYVLLAACGLAFLADVARRWRIRACLVVAIFLVGAVLADWREATAFVRRLEQPRAYFSGDRELVRYVKANTEPGDTIWNLVREGSSIYAHADRLSPTRFYYVSVHLFRDLPDPEAARREIRCALDSHPPKLVLFDGNDAWLAKVHLDDWFRANYAPAGFPSVYKRKP